MVDRLIAKFDSETGPALFVSAGLHGNEPAGVLALQEVVAEIQARDLRLNGSFYGVAGNLPALAQKKRYLKQDLNRLWKVAILEQLKSGKTVKHPDAGELNELIDVFELAQEVLKKKGKKYFIDLHTTSSQSIPFIPVNDTLLNRSFTKNLPIPSVLGIEEFLQGAFLSYINEYKVVALGFEAGQHDDPQSVYYHKAMIWLSLLNTGIVKEKDVPQANEFIRSFKKLCDKYDRFYEIRRRFKVEENSGFVMMPGYKSFDMIRKDDLLAHDHSGPIRALEGGNIFMPLYQSQGAEGFFIIRPVSPFWLRLSAWLRRLHLEDVLLLLPGLRRHPEYEGTLIVNTRIARFLANELFHLLGYRRKRKLEGKIFFTKREL